MFKELIKVLGGILIWIIWTILWSGFVAFTIKVGFNSDLSWWDTILISLPVGMIVGGMFTKEILKKD